MSSRGIAAIIPAAGLGTRLHARDRDRAATPKALLLLGGRSLLQRSVDALGSCADEIVVALPPEQMRAGAGDGLVCPSGTTITLVSGGATRQQSVRNALAAISDSATLVLVHDAARALVPVDVVRRVIAALQSGATCVVPVLAPPDSVRQVSRGDHSTGENRAIDRGHIRLVQTPQGFTVDALRRGHEAAESDLATDDATLVEATGERVTLVDGDALAFKITRPLDLVLAEALVADGQR